MGRYLRLAIRRRGTANGDLYLSFAIMPHKESSLEGVDLFLDIPVSVYAAKRGTTLQLITISGTFKLAIHPETRNGTILKLKSKGFPVYGKTVIQGDWFLGLVIHLPEKLKTREKELLRELGKLRNEEVEAGTVTP
jgi:curved DNA-binding protein